jgi:hypothetical protein
MVSSSPHLQRGVAFMGTLLVNILLYTGYSKGGPCMIPMPLDFPIQHVGPTQVLKERYFE